MTCDHTEEWEAEKSRKDLEVIFPKQHELIPDLEDEDDLSEFLKVVQIGPRRWRILESPVFSEAVTWGNVVEADVDGRCLVIEKIAEPHQFKTIRTMVSRMFYFSDFGKAFLDKVLELGGMWEIIFWGILILNLPEGRAEELEDLFAAACREAHELGKTEHRLPNHLYKKKPMGGSLRQEEEN
jgi:hypothetical protein